MNRKDLCGKIFGILNVYADPKLIFTPNSFSQCGVRNLRELDSIIGNGKHKGAIEPIRPKQPPFGQTGGPLYTYKKGMGAYISQWGFKFESIEYIPISVLEATANYLEANTNFKQLEV